MSARITCLLLLFLVAYPLAAQDGSQSTHLKFSIVFADGVQPTFDRLDGRKPASVDESKREASFLLGDKQFYKGHYNDAARNYNQALTYFNRFSPPQGSELVAITQSKDIDAFKIRQSISKLRPAIEVIMAGVDLTKLTQEDIWNLTEGLHTFGILFQTRGNYVMADRIFNQALKIRGEKIGKTSEPYVSTLHSIAVLRKDQGKYAASEEIFKYLFKYYEKLKGKTSREYAIVLNNKAMLDATLGRTKDAVRQLEEILAMGSGVFLAEGIDLERVQANRALLAKESGDYVLATSILQKAIDNVVAKEMDDHPDYYDMVVMLGDLYLRQGRAATDMSQFEKALQKVKSRYGEDNIIYSKTLEILAEVQLRDKKFVEAKTSFARILQIRGSVLGTKHKDYLSALIRLGICEWKSMDLNSAELHFMQATEGYFFLVEELFPSMSETEKTNFWGMLKLQVDIFQSFTLENYRQKPDLLKRFYDLQIKTKGLLLNNANQVRNSILASADSEAIKLYNAWITAKELLSTYYRATLGDLKEEDIDIKSLEGNIIDMERNLSRKSSLFSATHDSTSMDWLTVRNRLLPGEAAVELIRINRQYNDENGAVYVALILKPGASQPLLINIGNGDELEKKYFSFYRNSILNKIEDKVSHEKYWAPLESALANTKTIYVSPDGIYNSINLNTLKKSNGNYLIDEKEIVLLSNTKFIHQKKSIASEKRGEVVLIGDPSFGNDQLINRLPGTRAEIELLQAILVKNSYAMHSYLGDLAKEEVVKKAANESILHIATHGFFMDDISHNQRSAMGVQISKAKENPLLRSGLLFTGAAGTMKDEPLMGQNDDGILTAYEAMNLNLQGTSLVVLSACETGKGEVVNGEGVYGLSRAFKVAGAEAVIMSLWKVDDAATQKLMTAFYAEWVGSADFLPSFIEAQKQIRQEFPDPYYWGAFILIN